MCGPDLISLVHIEPLPFWSIYFTHNAMPLHSIVPALCVLQKPYYVPFLYYIALQVPLSAGVEGPTGV